MKKSRIGVALLATVWLIGIDLTGLANPGASVAPPVGPTEEARALGAFFSGNGRWKGTVSENVLGPGEPATTSRGKATCRQLYGGFWYVCDVQDVIGEGESAVTWKGHMLIGYDSTQNMYRAMVADNQGGITLFEGELEGDRFSLETPEPVLIKGEMMRMRLTWKKRDDGGMLFTDERQLGEGDGWTLFESAEIERESD